MRVRAYAPADAAHLAELLRSYMREAYSKEWSGSEAALAANSFLTAVRTLVAEAPDGTVAGFIAWTDAYDLHHCVSGGQVLDMFVVPAARGQGVAVQLLLAAARAVYESGGSYLRGSALEPAPVRALYARAAVSWDERSCIVGGKAFRHLAGLAGRPLREVVRSMPPVEWNYEG